MKEYVKPIVFPYKKVVKVYEKPIGKPILSISRLSFFSPSKFPKFCRDRIGWMGTVIAVSSVPRGLSRALAWNFYVTEETTIKYQLSNPLFVKLGWTVLPVSKIMRKVIEYQTNPAKPHLDWYVSSIVNSKSNPRFPPSPILLLYITFLKRINQRLLCFNEYYSPIIYYEYARTRLKRNLKQTLSVFFFLFLSFIQFRDIRFEIHPRLNTSRIYIYISGFDRRGNSSSVEFDHAKQLVKFYASANLILPARGLPRWPYRRFLVPINER